MMKKSVVVVLGLMFLFSGSAWGGLIAHYKLNGNADDETGNWDGTVPSWNRLSHSQGENKLWGDHT
jgi:hypothetical protein